MTLSVWTEAFENALGKSDYKLDAHRIEAAFKEARKELEWWPAPATVIKMMPRRPEQRLVSDNHGPPSDRDRLLVKRATLIFLDTMKGVITKEEGKKLMGQDSDTDEYAQRAKAEM